MSNQFGRSVIATTGKPLQVLANLDGAKFPTGGITLDWVTITAMASDTTFGDGTVVKTGKKAIPYGTVLCAKRVAEVQSITIDATGGTFTATGNAATTGNLAYNASAAAVQTALRALGGVMTAVEVTAVRNRYTLTEADGTDGGTFGLRVARNGVSRLITGIAYNAAASTIQAALVALDIIGAAGAVVSGNAAGPYTVAFAATLGAVDLTVVNDLTADGGVLEGGIALAHLEAPVYLLTYPASLGNVAAVTTDATSLTGGAGTAAVATVAAGSATNTYGPYDSAATDGRQTLQRSHCFVLNETILEDDPSGAQTVHPVAFDGGTAWRARLRVGGVNPAYLGSGNEPSWGAFEAALPMIRYAED